MCIRIWTKNGAENSKESSQALSGSTLRLSESTKVVKFIGSEKKS